MKNSQHERGPGKGRDANEASEQNIRLEPKERSERVERSEGSERTDREGQARIDLAQMIAALRQQFEQDRLLASQSGSARCGICYLHYRQPELYYREEEGFYICKNCQRTLGNGRIKMIRRQHR